MAAVEEEVEKDSSAVVDKLVDAIIEKLTVVREYKKPEKKAAVPAPAETEEEKEC